MTKEQINKYGSWYFKAHHKIIDKFGLDSDLFCRILAACSPRKQVLANWRMAHRVYYKSRLGLSPFTTGMMPCHKGNVVKALLGKDLSGRKVSNFYHNLIGDWNSVTIDSWTMRYFGIEKDRIIDKQYLELENRIKRIARYHHVFPCQVQATAWCLSVLNAGRQIKEF